MKKQSILILIISIFIIQVNWAQSPEQDTEKDMKMIFDAIERYNEAWRTKNVSLAVQDYSGNIHWVNSVGDVKMTRKSLEEYLSFVFTLDVVMNQKRLSQSDQITYLSDKIGVVHSLHIESGAKNYHLRVFSKEGDSWKIINHIVSREHPKE
ncbi:MAG: hypothetical protein AAF843_16110 [Bacteroidota bacterium]